MRKFNVSTFKLPVIFLVMALLAVSCSRSPYNFVKVQPKKPVERVSPESAVSPAVAASPSSVRSSSATASSEVTFRTPALAPAPGTPAAHRDSERRQAKQAQQKTRTVVSRELKKSDAFGALSAKKLEKVEKIITKQANKLAKKKATSPAPVGFNQWMKIGVILLLIGLVVGIAFADLGYLVAVIGIVFLVLGLIQQL
ncbi:MAG: hypothetical protein FWJ85_04045 [Solitalea sp.]